MKTKTLLMGLLCPVLATTAFGGRDACLWTQGPWDEMEGQSSGTGTALESRTADEFCLKEGYVHKINSITVDMLTDSTEINAVATLFHDCNGCPGELVDCGQANLADYEILQEDVNGPLDLVRMTFDFCAREEIDEYGEIVEIPALWLKGGCYWLSPAGVGDGTGYDRYFWATAGDDLLGAIPKTQAGELKVGVDFWELVSNVNVGCRNFVFDVNGYSCCLVNDSSEATDDVTDSVDTTRTNCFNADNFLISPCVDEASLCFFSAYIWTNCECERTKVQFVGDECLEIEGPSRRPLLEESFGEFEYTADKCVQITGFGPSEGGVSFDGLDLALYRVEFHDLEIPVNGGDNIWALLHVQGTGSFQERGFWAFHSDCKNPGCEINISEGQAVCGQSGVFEYTPVGHDYAFCVAIDERRENGSDNGEQATGCVADMDGNGSADIADLISFLGHWFEGCEQ